MTVPKLTLEAVLTSPRAFALTTASNVQRGICRIVDGLPLGGLANDPAVQESVGGREACESLPHSMPAEVYLLAAIRSGKSLLAAALAFKASQTCDVSRLRPGETPRISVVSTATQQAKVIRDHLVGSLLAKQTIGAFLIEEPTQDTLLLRHPSGRPVEIKIVAGSRAGSTLVARWSAGAIFDEFPRMAGSEDGVVNFDDARRAVLGRLLPGAQLVAIGSPWAPFGPAYRVVQKHFGHPTKKLVVIRATGPMMNPRQWTPEACEELRLHDPIVYRTDVLGEFADHEASMFGTELVEDAVRKEPRELPPVPGVVYGAAMDPATRGNSWTLVVVRLVWTGKGPKTAVVLARQWTGSSVEALSPEEVLGEMAAILRPYKVDVVSTDQWAVDALRDIAYRHKLALKEETLTMARNVELYDTMKMLLGIGRLELPPVPELATDLRRVRRVLTRDGVRIDLPRTQDGRHCDYASSLALAMTITLPEPVRDEAKAVEEPDELFERLLRENHAREQSMRLDPLDRDGVNFDKLDG